MKYDNMVNMNPKNIIKKIEKRIRKKGNTGLKLALKDKTSTELTDLYFRLIEDNKTYKLKKCKPYFKKGEPILYMIRCTSISEDFIKIGITRRSVVKRFEKDMPYKYEIIKTLKVRNDALEDYESAIHSFLNEYRYNPILSFSGFTECFTIDAISDATKLF